MRVCYQVHAQPQTADAPRTPAGLQRGWLARAVAPLLAVLLGIAFFASWSPASAVDGVAVVVSRLGACVAPLAYLASAIGLGTLVRRWTWNSRTIGACVGLCAIILSTHVLSMLGLLSQGTVGAGAGWVAWLVVLPGLVALAWSMLRDAHSGGQELRTMLASCPRWALPGAFGAGLMLAGAACAPGTLWRSEFGGFDALSYHLQLPQEWMLGHSATPARHNVYSFLPGAMESAFLHVAWLVRAPWGAEPSADPLAPGMLASDGAGLRAAQALHAGVGVLAALAWARVAGLCAVKTAPRAPQLPAGDDARVERFAGGVCFSMLMLTPWLTVVGSLAYNEMGLVLLGGACARVLLQKDSAGPRGACLVALFVGVACALKPTALFMVGVPAGVVLVARLVRGAWGARATGRDRVRVASLSLGLGLIVGLATLAPWLMRNHTTSGNPVFPFASAWFASEVGGTGHWSGEQVDRFARSHAFLGTWGDRLRLLVLPDASDPMGPTMRGIAHPQWGVLLLGGLFAGGALAVLLRKTPAKGSLVALSGVLPLQLALWLATTHVQSRFLLPVAGVAGCACVVAIAAIGWDARRGPVRALVACVAIAAQAGFLIRTLAGERQGAGGALLASVELFTGHPGAGVVPEDQRSPEHVVNRLPRDARVLTIGESVPLYMLSSGGLPREAEAPLPRVVYATTWDEQPFVIARGSAGEREPQTHSQWTRRLRERGFTHVLINFAELDRLERSGFLDPMLAPSEVGPWAQSLGPPLRVWAEQGRVLIALP